MGANQSSGQEDGRGGPSSDKQIKTCYYELLGVDPRATDEEIKKAYRRKALELHPDRNYENVENATRLFSDVQAAYDVLSDPQERAWYDSHRDAILRGADEDVGGDHYEHNVRVTTADDIMRMFGKFSTRMDFSDSPRGFFAVLREAFDTLAHEEDAATQWEGLDAVDYPSFGHGDDDYETVVRPFYAAWSGFSTDKTFSWKDKYRLSDAPDRRVRRAMEKENKRAREEGIREFNDAVRSLVAFVRKRDPRYIPNTQSEADRQKALRDASAAQAARSRAANKAQLEGHVVPDWAKSEELEHHADESDEDIEDEHFECVMCRKTFKSEKQFEAHERSKKHVKAIQQLERTMPKGSRPSDLRGTIGTSINGLASQEERPEEEEIPSAPGTPDDSNERIDASHSGISSRPDSPDAAEPALDTALSDAEGHTAADHPSSNDADSDYAPREEVATRMLSNHDPPHATADVDSLSNDLRETSLESPTGDSDSKRPKVGKAKAKRAKRAAEQKAAEKEGSDVRCAACGESFASRSKLFAHVKALDHAQPVPKPSGGRKAKKK
ncbi:MAG: hypothetical protein M1833_004692 [Piccolia ochrophora]|nr:MAG: hypothetical protein M1833_004692 [Piccolia ochrophora]